MTASVIDGRAVAAGILTAVDQRAGRLRSIGVAPHLTFVTLGDIPDAQLYARRLERMAARTGIEMSRTPLPWDVSLPDLDSVVARINANRCVDGVIVQLPLPYHLTSADLSTIIDPRKDVDGLTVENAGRLYLGMPGRVASTAVAMIDLLDHMTAEVAGAHAVVIGRSHVVGHPVAELLLHRSATVTVVHRQTRGLARFTREADILMVGAGEPHLVTRDMIKPGAVIIDAGITVTDRGVLGDVDFEGCREVAGALTPVPGGVGPVTNAVLMRNVIDSAEQRDG